jgi:hypothetical protein
MPHSSIPWVVSTGFIFPFTYMCTQYLDHIHPRTPFPHLLTLPLIQIPQTGPVLPSYSLILLKKKKKRHLCLFKVSIYTRSFFVTFPCIYVFEPELVHLLYFSPFYLSLLLMMISTSLKFPYSFMYTEYINHIHLLNFLLLPTSLTVTTL